MLGAPKDPVCGGNAAALFQGDDVFRLQALAAFGDGELHALAFTQDAMAIAGDGAEVHEDVFAVVPLDEAEALAGAEPFDAARFLAAYRSRGCLAE